MERVGEVAGSGGEGVRRVGPVVGSSGKGGGSSAKWRGFSSLVGGAYKYSVENRNCVSYLAQNLCRTCPAHGGGLWFRFSGLGTVCGGVRKERN